ncbi:MAG TPA: hypothetical protein VK569_01670, partial [Bacteroidota bacterium]|nr:hypothetical protein [Bacteroidota bacterium]
MSQTTDPRAAVSVPDEGEAPAGGLHILLVDDIQENLELLQDVLAENNYTSVLARNGVEALTKLRHERVHLIVA